ncbi:MAG: hypothetical protein U0939_07575 [Pirellulales bacterium]
MILNAYTVLDLALVAIRLPLGLFLIVWTWRAWRGSSGLGREGTGADAHRLLDEREGRLYLSLMAAGLLFVLNLLAWPLLYAVLQSYIPQWPGVMCIYGVTRIGVGSEGPSRFLPALLLGLQIVKPITVLFSGAWAWMYAASRRTATNLHQRRVAFLLVLFGATTLVDAAVEGAYMLTPKREQFAEAGCCTAPLEAELRSGRFAPSSWSTTRTGWLTGAFVVANLLLACLLGLQARNPLGAGPGAWLVLLTLATLAIPLNLIFFKEVASPQILRLEYHHCLYDLFVRAPESLVGAGFWIGGVYSTAWAWLTAMAEGRSSAQRRDGERAEAASGRATSGMLTSGLLTAGALGYLGCVIHFSVALVLV